MACEKWRRQPTTCLSVENDEEGGWKEATENDSFNFALSLASVYPKNKAVGWADLEIGRWKGDVERAKQCWSMPFLFFFLSLFYLEAS